jgi:hypothetical protein
MGVGRKICPSKKIIIQVTPMGAVGLNPRVVKLKSVSEDLLLSAERDDVRMTLPFLY